ncbi:MAG TPA: helix-turn-helix domain-containing protein, partial [Ktedonobacteraceae bacterium]
MPIITSSAVREAPVSDTMLVEDAALPRGFVQLPKAVLYARHLSRDAKLLYAVLLGYAWQEQRCFPGYQRLCADLNASENAVRSWMRELEAAHLISQRRRGQGRTNLYLFHDLRTAPIAVQEHHKNAVVEPQEAQDNKEAVQIKTAQEESDLRNSKRTPLRREQRRNELLFTYSSVLSTAKGKLVRSLAGQQTEEFTSLQPGSSPAQGHERSERTQGQRKRGDAQAHQLTAKRRKPPVWLPGYIVDFSREFHDEAATVSNITRAT